MNRSYKRFLNTALKEYNDNQSINNNITIETEKKIQNYIKPAFINYFTENISLHQNSGNICKECYGSGWKTVNFDTTLTFGFKYNICKKCNGTGYV